MEKELIPRPEVQDIAISISEEWLPVAENYITDAHAGPLPVVAYINHIPRLPLLPVVLELSGGLRLLDLAYSSWISYTDHNRNDTSPAIQGKSKSLVFNLDYGSYVMGGTVYLKVAAAYRTPSGQIGVAQNTFASSIKGENPSKDAIRTNLDALHLQVVGYKESRFMQFLASDDPKHGTPKGFGIMQIDTPPATIEQVWNWQVNVNAGKALWDVKIKESNASVANVKKQYPDATDLTEDQKKLDVYQRYNGGKYWGWDNEAKQWVKVPNSGYADDAIAIENNAQQGVFPADW